MFGFILRMIKAFFSKFQMINPFLEKQLSDDKHVPQNDFRMIKPFLKNELSDDKPVFWDALGSPTDAERLFTEKSFSAPEKPICFALSLTNTKSTSVKF